MLRGSSDSSLFRSKPNLTLTELGPLCKGGALFFALAALILICLFVSLINAEAARSSAAHWTEGWNEWKRGDAAAAYAAWSKDGIFTDLAKRPARNYYWRARALEKMGRESEAEALKKAMIRKFPLDYYTFIAIQEDGGSPAESAHAQAHALYPRPWFSEVSAASARSGVTPELIWAVMKKESKFRESAVSRSGAVGLMQLMPETAAETAFMTGIKGADPLRRDHNVILGAEHLALLIARFRGELPRALAAYNAGAGAVSKWDTLGACDWTEWVESIPYPETREYVRSVFENHEAYKMTASAAGEETFDMRGSPAAGKVALASGGKRCGS
jgi:soluble lytic murein transglycosylase-like protein